MNNLITSSDSDTSKVEFIQDSNALHEGMYAVIVELTELGLYERYSELAVGDILLITGLKFANNDLHSIELLDHPRNHTNNQRRKTFTHLINDFYKKYKVISQAEGELIRNKEIEAIKAKGKCVEDHLNDVSKNSEKLQAIAFEIYSKRLDSSNTPKFTNTGDIAGLLGSVNALEQINQLNSQLNMAKDLAKIQAQYLNENIARLKALNESIEPYTEERYKCAIAATLAPQKNLKKMNNGLASLNLFIGKGVRVSTIKQGKEAAYDVPLTLIQKCLFADEELSFFEEKEAEYLDANNIDQIFWSKVVNDNAFIGQILPTERCICVMAIRQNSIDYEDEYFNLVMNRENKSTFLIIRNGGNIHTVYSPISSHLAAKNLFPSQDTMEKHFFKGNGKIEININDLEYSYALQAIEKEALHYKRFLILLAGLQSQHNILGEFYPSGNSFDIFTPSFQEKYFNFIHDEDGKGLIEGEKELSLAEFVLIQNSKVGKGSLIVCHTKNMVNYYTASACYKYDYKLYSHEDGPYEKIKAPVSQYVLAEVQQDKDGLFVKIECENKRRAYKSKIQTVQAKVMLNQKEDTTDSNIGTIDYLCIDDLSESQILKYIQQRKYRKFYSKFIGLFKESILQLQSIKSKPDFNYNKYNQFVESTPNQIQLSNEAIEALLMTASTFFSHERNALNFLTFNISGETQDRIKALVMQQILKLNQNIELVSITMDNKGNSFAYVTMPENQRLDMLTDHAWLHRYELTSLKTGKLRPNPKTVGLRDNEVKERTLLVADPDLEATYYTRSNKSIQIIDYSAEKIKVEHKRPFIDYSQKMEFFKAFKKSKDLLLAFISNKVTRAKAFELKNIMDAVTQKNRDSISKRDMNNEGLTISLPVAVQNGQHSYFSVQINGALDWITKLSNSYLAPENGHVNLLKQDNLNACQMMIESRPITLTDGDLDLTNFFCSGRIKPNSFKFSSTSLAYVLSTAKNNAACWYARIPNDELIEYSLFEHNLFYEYNPNFNLEVQSAGQTQFTKIESLTIMIICKDLKSEKNISNQKSKFYAEKSTLSKIEKYFKDSLEKIRLTEDRGTRTKVYIEYDEEFIVDIRDLDAFAKDSKKLIWDKNLKCYAVGDLNLKGITLPE